MAHELCTYASRARFYKYWYNCSQIAIFCIPVLIVAFQNINWQYSNVLVTIFSVFISAISGICNALAFRKKWEHYRYYLECSKHELYLYLVSSGPYRDNEEKEKTLVVNMESLIKEEGEGWRAIMKKQEENKGDDKK